MAGCSSCSTTTGTGGCQNNGTCGTSDCNKMNAFDWLTHMGIPTVDTYDVVEIKFKGGRKEYFRNVAHLALTTGDPVVVDVQSGHHIGYVSLQGELVRLQMQKRKVRDDESIPRIYRLANDKDLEKWEEAKNREIPTLYRTKQIIDELGLQMKLSDIEFQADNTKATFYYSADERVDFRELIKVLASEFRIRIEMRQISLRQEAGRLGGIGVCGRELCCSTWMHDFKSVSTSAARYQNLSLNPGKLSGQCGRLKCCLNYELDTYMNALADIPEVDRPLLTEQGSAKLQKTDIFRKLMWFSYQSENNWHSITCERVKEIQALNAAGKKPFNLEFDDASEVENSIEKATRELELLDKKFATQNKKKKKKKRRTGEEPAGELTHPRPASRPTNRRSPRPNEGDKNTPAPNRRRGVAAKGDDQAAAGESKRFEGKMRRGRNTERNPQEAAERPDAPQGNTNRPPRPKRQRPQNLESGEGAKSAAPQENKGSRNKPKRERPDQANASGSTKESNPSASQREGAKPEGANKRGRRKFPPRQKPNEDNPNTPNSND